MKDIEREVYRRLEAKESFNAFQMMKKEAIKWVKNMIKKHPLGETGNCYMFMKFFNITEEDLK